MIAFYKVQKWGNLIHGDLILLLFCSCCFKAKYWLPSGGVGGGAETGGKAQVRQLLPS